jgi:hypothetical protein
MYAVDKLRLFDPLVKAAEPNRALIRLCYCDFRSAKRNKTM